MNIYARMLYILIPLVLIINQELKAQKNYDLFSYDSSITYGAFVNININHHFADFKDFQGIATCCPRFESGTGLGFGSGVFFELPFPKILKIGLRGGFNSISADLIKDEFTTIIDNEELAQGKFEHYLNTSIWNIGVSPYLTARLYKGLNLFIGGHYSYTLKSDFDYVERLVQPENRGVFIDTRTRERNKHTGKIPLYSEIYGALFVGLSYELPINKERNLRLSPEISYYKGLTELAFEKNWTADILKFGLSLKYSAIPKKKEIPKIKRIQYIVDTVVVDVDYIPDKTFKKGEETIVSEDLMILDTLVTVEKYSRTDTLFQLKKPIAKIGKTTEKLDIKARFVTEAFPLLPIIFFPKESAEIPREYILGDDDFDINKFEIRPIVYHRNILKILGKRLNENPRATITLIGYADSTTENGNCQLANKRAEAVKDYFINELDIKPNRIKISRSNKKCTPLNPTLTPNDSGFAENRRVEIFSDFPKILDPIIRENFLELEFFESNEVIIDISQTSKFATKRKIILRQKNKIIKEVNADNSEIFSLPIDENLAKNLVFGNLDIELFIEDPLGRTSKDTRTIFVNKDTNNYAVERLSIVLFDVGSDKLSQFAINSIKTFVKGLRTGSIVQIIGYTDELGLWDNNLLLSQNRANNVASIIREHQPDADIIKVEGIASKRKPFGIQSYASPAERFLSRTVQIEILKLIK